jgi:predicted dehydrogenase
VSRPRLGFVGVGWIGRNRLEAIAASATADAVAVADAAPALAEAVAAATGAAVEPVDRILDGGLGLDGVVIATPNALHAGQSVRALSAGMGVFCQKPLARTGREAAAVVEAARSGDRLLGVDLSYRHLVAVERIRELIAGGEIGEVFASRLTFHNAYGPDKSWYGDPELAGGGCVIDLGVHLIDLALWMQAWPEVLAVTSTLFRAGRRLTAAASGAEDFATIQLELTGGSVVDIACSWRLHAGRDAEIGASFHGTRGSVRLSNVAGSFYDFRATHDVGTASRSIAEPPDSWDGRAALAWTRRLATAPGFDPDADRLLTVARVIDQVYGR